jgi:flagellar L-ring protein precursor FlgH
MAGNRQCSALQQYLNQIEATEQQWSPKPSAGSLYMPGARMGDLARDVRAAYVGDTITVVVSERATAVARGSSSSSRKSNVSAGVTAALGPLRAEGPLGKLAGANSASDLKGEGETTRTMQLSTTVTAIVERQLPNGNLLLRGSKEIAVNSERQIVEIRGIVRPEDLLSGNSVPSERIAMLEVHVNGKGVVGDAIRRPMFLYRLLLGLLPF